MYTSNRPGEHPSVRPLAIDNDLSEAGVDPEVRKMEKKLYRSGGRRRAAIGFVCGTAILGMAGALLYINAAPVQRFVQAHVAPSNARAAQTPVERPTVAAVPPPPPLIPLPPVPETADAGSADAAPAAAATAQPSSQASAKAPAAALPPPRKPLISEPAAPKSRSGGGHARHGKSKARVDQPIPIDDDPYSAPSEAPAAKEPAPAEPAAPPSPGDVYPSFPPVTTAKPPAEPAPQPSTPPAPVPPPSAWTPDQP